MSLLIKGMEMPKNCDDCSLRSFSLDGMICRLIDENVTNQEFAHKRRPNCPLAETPTPHGDLIDRNLLLKEYEPNPEDDQRMKEESFKDYVLMEKIVGIATESINEMPIIIEAED